MCCSSLANTTTPTPSKNERDVNFLPSLARAGFYHARPRRCPDSLAQSVRGRLFCIVGDYILVVVAHN
jgi:hypothetical protein